MTRADLGVGPITNTEPAPAVLYLFLTYGHSFFSSMRRVSNERLQWKKMMKRYFILLDIIFIGAYIGVMYALYYLMHLPRHISTFDLILLGFAVARISDIISTDEVMQWLREPFIRLEQTEVAGRGTEMRIGRGEGLRRVIGEMLSCPWCVGIWVAAGLTYLYFLVPRYIWLFILLMAIAEIGSLLQTISTIFVRIEKYIKSLGVSEEGI